MTGELFRWLFFRNIHYYPRPQGAAGSQGVARGRKGQSAVKCTNVNVRHTYWAPHNPVTEALHACSWVDFISVAYMPEGVAEHSFLGCSHQSTCMPNYSLYVQLLWYQMYYPGGMEALVSPVQWSEPHSILDPTQDSNPGGRIQNHKRWPLHYRCRVPMTVIRWI